MIDAIFGKDICLNIKPEHAIIELPGNNKQEGNKYEIPKRIAFITRGTA